MPVFFINKRFRDSYRRGVPGAQLPERRYTNLSIRRQTVNLDHFVLPTNLESVGDSGGSGRNRPTAVAMGLLLPTLPVPHIMGYKPNCCRYALGETPVCRWKRLRKNATSLYPTASLTSCRLR